MKTLPIEWFWTKMMVASRSINKIPSFFLKIAQNARIFDWWIWPRRWKTILTESIIWTNNKGAFAMNDKLYQITNSKIYEIDLDTWVQTDRATLWYDKTTDILVYKDKAIIVSDWEDLEVFNWTWLETTPTTVPATNSWIIEYTRWFSFLVSDNILYISRPITPANPEYAYDFTWSWSQQITYDNNIVGLEWTMNWLYVTTTKKTEFLWANALQNVAWSATFISTPLWKSWEPVNNHCIVSSWDKIFFITKSLQLQTINYIEWTDSTSIWSLSARPIIWIKELLNDIDVDQPSSFAVYNKKDETIQFHLRRKNMPFNDICLIYDITNDTYSIDTGKNYNYVVEQWEKYYWFSDVNSSIYNDDIGFNDAWVPIRFLIRTQEMNQWTIMEKQYWWMFTAWWIWFLTTLNYNVKVDRKSVFSDIISWDVSLIPDLWEIWGWAIWDDEIWGWVEYSSTLEPFEKMADQWRIRRNWNRISVEISSNSDIQDFIIDILWVMADITWHLDINNKF